MFTLDLHITMICVCMRARVCVYYICVLFCVVVYVIVCACVWWYVRRMPDLRWPHEYVYRCVAESCGNQEMVGDFADFFLLLIGDNTS